MPDPEQWDAILNGRELPRPPRSTLITDFYSYNTNLSARFSDLVGESHYDQEGAWMQPHWVGDLTLESIDRREAGESGRLGPLGAGRGGDAHRCTIDLATGVATFTRGDEEVLGHADTPIKGPGRHHVEFANVDDRMTLVVDGRAVGEPGFAYETGEANPIPTAADLAPAAVAVRNASVEASDLVLKRDIYYTQYPGRYRLLRWSGTTIAAEPDRALRLPVRPDAILRPRAGCGHHEYEVGQDRYFMMGDNSPRSKDSRGWGTDDCGLGQLDRAQGWEVPRQFLTGKAFYVYWPHGMPFGPEAFRSGRDIRFLFRPYVERMKWIR